MVESYLRNAASLAQEVGYVPLPARACELALANLKQTRFGTAFGGHAEGGVRIEQLLQREGKL